MLTLTQPQIEMKRVSWALRLANGKSGVILIVTSILTSFELNILLLLAGCSFSQFELCIMYLGTMEKQNSKENWLLDVSIGRVILPRINSEIMNGV